MSVSGPSSFVQPPCGVVTFLFTDIEGSTRLWERCPAGMKPALARHDSLLREAIESRGGYVFKTMGDAFCAAFSSPFDALSAALSAQRGLAGEQWGEVSEMRVRMALHTGEVELREDDYFGPPLNLASRLLSAGHGGQILLTRATKELLRNQLPAECEFRDLGQRRLRDITRAVHVYQLCSPDLPLGFPPLKTLDACPNNLPAETAPLIGRDGDLESVKRELATATARLLTLTGPGGSGKTRLALRAAAELLEVFEHGAFFVDLSPVRDASLVGLTIAGTLGLEVTDQRTPAQMLRSTLHDRHILLVLDNFEQVLSAATELGELLSACPRLVLLVTSREPLLLRWEHVFSVAPLRLPDLDHLPPPDELGDTPAVALFVQRARAAKADFLLGEENAQAIAEICVRLDGLPLAIELAAARCNILPPQAILSRLERRLQLLSARTRDAPSRHGTLRDAIGWSYDLLTADEQAAFRRLGVFVGWDLEAARLVSGTVRLAIDGFETVASLVEKGLVQALESSSAAPRFRMLETIQEYAMEQLEASGELAEAQRRHAHFFLALAEEGDAKLRTREQGDWVAKLVTEHDNLRTALAWAQSAAGESGVGWRLGWALGWFWHLHGDFHEGRHWLDQILAASDDAPLAERGRLMVRTGTLAYDQGDLPRAQLLLEEGVGASRAAEDHWVAALGVAMCASVALYQGHIQTAQVLSAEARGLFEALGDRWGVSMTLYQLARQACDLGDCEVATAHLEALLAGREPQDIWALASTLHLLGRVAYARGDYERAQALQEDTLGLARRLEARRYIAWALQHLGRIALALGEHAKATELLQDSLASAVQRGDKPGIVDCLEGIAAVAAGQSYHERASKLFGAAEALRTAFGLRRPPVDQEEYELFAAAARSGLGQDEHAAAWERGRTLSLDRAVEYARGEARARDWPRF